MNLMEAMAEARVLLGDVPSGKQYPPEILKPVANIVYRRIQEAFSEHGLSVLQKEVEFTLPANDIVADNLLPSDLFIPRRMWERPSAGSAGGTIYAALTATNATPAEAVFLAGFSSQTDEVTVDAHTQPRFLHFATLNPSLSVIRQTTSSFNGRLGFVADPIIVDIGGRDYYSYRSKFARNPAGQRTWVIEGPQSSQPSEDADYVLMERVIQGLPPLNPGEPLRFWGWWDRDLRFIGSTHDRVIRLRYDPKLPELDWRSPSDEILVLGSENAMVYGMVSHALGAHDQKSADQDDGMGGRYYNQFMGEIGTLISRHMSAEKTMGCNETRLDVAYLQLLLGSVRIQTARSRINS